MAPIGRYVCPSPYFRTLAYIIVEKRNVRRPDRRALRVVLRAARSTGLDRARRSVYRAGRLSRRASSWSVFSKLTAVHPKVRLDPVGGGQPRILVQLFGDLLLLLGAQIGSQCQRVRIRPNGELLHFAQERLERSGAAAAASCDTRPWRRTWAAPAADARSVIGIVGWEVDIGRRS